MEPNPSATRELVDELLEEWGEYENASTMHQPAARRGKVITGADVARITAVIGLARHVHDTSRAVLLLLDAGHEAAATPLVRLAYEGALTAAWLVQSREQHGVLAFLHEHARTRAALKRDASQAMSFVYREGVNHLRDTDMTPYIGSLDSARQFAQVCDDLTPGGKDAYVLYRILSAYSHASVQVVDLYFAPGATGGIPSSRSKADGTIGQSGLLFLTASAMIWSARAHSYLTQDKTHRNSLRRAARALGINAELQLSESYYRRHARGESPR